MRRTTGAVALLAALLLAAPAPGQGVDDAIRQLRRAVVAQRDNGHLPLLAALRQLRDPRLAPLFRHLAAHEDWQVQVHAVLARVELSDDARLQPAHLAPMDPRGHEHVIAHAVDGGHLDAVGAAALLAIGDLSPSARLLAAGEAIRGGVPVDVAGLRPLLEESDPRAAVLAACLLAETDDPGWLDHARRGFDATDQRGRDRLRQWACEAIRQYRLESALPLVHETLAVAGLDRHAEAAAVLALLELDRAAGLAAWRGRLGADPSQARKVRFVLLLLAAGPPYVAEPLARVGSGDPPLAALIEVGRTLAAGDDPAGPLMDLLDLDHARSTAWALDALDDLPDSTAIPVLVHLLDAVESDPPPTADRVAAAVEATTSLYRRAPALVVERLHRVEDDGLAQQALLLGLYDVHDPGVLDAVRRLPHAEPGRADSIALILLARHAPELAAPDLDQLATVAAGGGRVGPGLRVQAAWLYLRHSGAADAAFQRLLTPGRAPS